MNAVEEQAKIDATTHFRQHVETAQKERQIYNDCIKRAKEEHNESPTTRYNHYTFDFSQAVSIPHYSRQLEPIYFASLRKVQVFGVRIDGIPNQMNFLIDENETIGKDGKQTHGPNAVISMLDYILETQGRWERSISLHADNCPGQNKNRFVIGYFVWRVMTGRNREVEYLMQVPGHARCLVDGGFGHVKKLYRRSNTETMDKLEQVVRSSAKNNETVRYPAWQWRDWKSYMAQMFKPVPGIRQYQYFKTTIDEPGIIIMRAGNGEPDVRVNIVQRGANISGDLPPVIQPGGLTRQHQEYLYKTARPYLLPENQNITCPEPHDED